MHRNSYPKIKSKNNYQQEAATINKQSKNKNQWKKVNHNSKKKMMLIL